AAGASIIDIGGMSSRPGAEVISVEEELKRVLPKIEAIVQDFPNVIISVDTVQSEVAKATVAAGARIVNDISAGSIDPKMYATVADLDVPYILMHMQGTPKSMQLQPHYEDVKQEVLDFLIREVGKLKALDIKDIIIDPGFGFGKSLEDNYALLRHLHLFQILECPILAGVSRKSMIYKYLDIPVEEALNATSVLNLVALQQGARILRVHDVQEAMQTIRLWEMLESV
ncbi:MAG: dihydropteroate synthase, partial [Bacteroidota bacterium]